MLADNIAVLLLAGVLVVLGGLWGVSLLVSRHIRKHQPIGTGIKRS